MNKAILLVAFSCLAACGGESPDEIVGQTNFYFHDVAPWPDLVDAVVEMRASVLLPTGTWDLDIHIYPDGTTFDGFPSAFYAPNLIQASVLSHESFVSQGCLPHEIAHKVNYLLGGEDHDEQWAGYAELLYDAAERTQMD